MNQVQPEEAIALAKRIHGLTCFLAESEVPDGELEAVIQERGILIGQLEQLSPLAQETQTWIQQTVELEEVVVRSLLARRDSLALMLEQGKRSKDATKIYLNSA